MSKPNKNVFKQEEHAGLLKEKASAPAGRKITFLQSMVGFFSIGKGKKAERFEQLHEDDTDYNPH